MTATRKATRNIHPILLLFPVLLVNICKPIRGKLLDTLLGLNGMFLPYPVNLFSNQDTVRLRGKSEVSCDNARSINNSNIFDYSDTTHLAPYHRRNDPSRKFQLNDIPS